MFVPTTIVELGALMTDLEANPSVKVVESVRNADSYRTSVEQRHVLPNLAKPSAQARRAKVRNMGYGDPSD